MTAATEACRGLAAGAGLRGVFIAGGGRGLTGRAGEEGSGPERTPVPSTVTLPNPPGGESRGTDPPQPARAAASATPAARMLTQRRIRLLSSDLQRGKSPKGTAKTRRDAKARKEQIGAQARRRAPSPSVAFAFSLTFPLSH